jgi:hypothetical protein
MQKELLAVLKAVKHLKEKVQIRNTLGTHIYRKNCLLPWQAVKHLKRRSVCLKEKVCLCVRVWLCVCVCSGWVSVCLCECVKMVHTQHTHTHTHTQHTSNTHTLTHTTDIRVTRRKIDSHNTNKN